MARRIGELIWYLNSCMPILLTCRSHMITYDYDYSQSIASVVLPGMTPEGKRTEFRPLSDHDGLIGQDKTIMTSKMMIIGQD